MKIFVKVRAGAKEDKVVEVDVTHFTVRVKAPAKEGKANHAVASLMAKYFGTSIFNIDIISGHTSKSKVFEIK